jgi:hypothetical protein
MSTPRLSRSPKLYQERKQPDHRTTRRYPALRHDLAINPAHALPMSPPLPTVPVLHAEDNKPPDAGLTEVWPHGEVEI